MTTSTTEARAFMILVNNKADGSDAAHRYCVDVTDIEPHKPGQFVMFEPAQLEFYKVGPDRVRKARLHPIESPIKLATSIDQRMDDFHRWERRFNKTRCQRVVEWLAGRKAVKVRKAEVATVREAVAVEAATVQREVRQAARKEAQATVVAFVVVPVGVKQAVRVEPVHGDDSRRICTVRRKWNDPTSALSAVTVTADKLYDTFEVALDAWRAERAASKKAAAPAAVERRSEAKW